jgi:hypothetical protein
MIRIVISQVSGDTAGEVIVAITDESMGDRFGQQFGQYSQAALQVPGQKN